MKKFLLLIIIFTSSCSSIKTVANAENTVEEKINLYVKKYAPAATKNLEEIEKEVKSFENLNKKNLSKKNLTLKKNFIKNQ